MKKEYRGYQSFTGWYGRFVIEWLCPHCESTKVKILKDDRYRSAQWIDGGPESRDKLGFWLCLDCSLEVHGGRMLSKVICREALPKPTWDRERTEEELAQHKRELLDESEGVLDVWQRGFFSPRQLAFKSALDSKMARLDAPHVKPLNNYIRQLKMINQGTQYPFFDPDDGGVNARILFLFEKPGPMTDPTRPGRSGSGFISRDNDDPTAENTFRFMEEIKLPRNETVTWNIIPGWNGTRKITSKELLDGVSSLKELLSFFQVLTDIVLVGRKAQLAMNFLPSKYRVISSSHPSNLVRARYPEKWRAIPLEWSKVNI